MADLTIIDLVPAPPSKAGSAFLFVVGAIAVLLGLSSGAFWVVLGIACIGLGIHMKRAAGARFREEQRAYGAWARNARDVASRIANARDLAKIDVPVNLQRGEECYWVGEASWYELRAKTRSVNYSAVTASIPIAKGIRFRVGSISPSVERESQLTPIDNGTLYVTNKRVLFDGAEKNTTIQHKDLIGLKVLQGGIILEKGTGRSPHLMLREDAESAAALIARCLSGTTSKENHASVQAA